MEPLWSEVCRESVGIIPSTLSPYLRDRFENAVDVAWSMHSDARSLFGRWNLSFSLSFLNILCRLDFYVFKLRRDTFDRIFNR